MLKSRKREEGVLINALTNLLIFIGNPSINDQKLLWINQLAKQKPIRGVSSDTYQLVYLNKIYTRFVALWTNGLMGEERR